MMTTKQFHSLSRSPRGSVLILAMGITIVLTGLVLVFARQMRVEALISGNMQSGLQANAIADGAARHVLNRLANNTSPTTLNTDIQSQGVAIGNGMYWIVRPDPTDEHNYGYGIVDEASKLDINTASVEMLTLLPDMTADLSASIINWRNNANQVVAGGAESEYYLLLPEPYYCKNSSFETLNELLMVKGATRDVLFGVDVNRNGVVDADEAATGTPVMSGINGQAQCGVCKYLTVYNTIPNKAKDGSQRFVLTNTSREAMTALSTFLARKSISNSAQIVTNLRRSPPARNVLDFYVKSGMKINDFKLIADYITTNSAKVLRGMININTAPREVLRCLPGLADSDIDLIIATRSSNSPDLDNIAWVAQTLPAHKAALIGGLITTRSFQYSADIVAVGENGHDFQRFKYVFDLRTSPPSIIYRKDITNLGWPLSSDVLQSLSSGTADNQQAHNMPTMPTPAMGQH